MSGELRTAMLIALTKMRLAGLRDYGRYPSDAASLALMAEVYLEAMEDGPPVGPAEIASATKTAIRGGADYPTPMRFRELVEAAHATAWRLVGEPVPGDPTTLRVRLVRRDDPAALPSPEPPALDDSRARARFERLMSDAAPRSLPS